MSRLEVTSPVAVYSVRLDAPSCLTEAGWNTLADRLDGFEDTIHDAVCEALEGVLPRELAGEVTVKVVEVLVRVT